MPAGNKEISSERKGPRPQTTAAFLASFLATRTGVVRSLIEEKRSEWVSLSEEEVKEGASLSKTEILEKIGEIESEFENVSVYEGVNWELEKDLEYLESLRIVEIKDDEVRLTGEFGRFWGDLFATPDYIKQAIEEQTRKEE